MVDWNRVLFVYTDEIISPAMAADEAYRRLLDAALSKHPSATYLHSEALTVMERSYSISLIFFLSKANRSVISEKRGAMMRKKYSIEKDSILMRRAIRNHSAHVDERIDYWSERSENRTFGRNMIGSKDDLVRVGIREIDAMSVIDPGSLDVIFWGDKINLHELSAEVHRLHKDASSLMEKLVWKPVG